MVHTKRPAPGMEFLAGGGEMGERIRALDWSKTPLGSTESWSSALRTVVQLMLANRLPMLLWWGPQYISIYNDPYRPVLGNKHPWGLGLPVSECWQEIWHILKPLIDTPFHGGPATWDEDILLVVNRYGFNEETHWLIAYSPVPDESVPSGIGGVLATVHETTEKVLSERRMTVLRDLGSRPAEAKTLQAACVVAAKTLEAHSKDIPFALLYLMDADGKYARLAATAGVAPGQDMSQQLADLEVTNGVWPLAEAKRTMQPQIVADLGARFSSVPSGPWPDPPTTAVVQPIGSGKPHEPAGFLVAGVSSRLRLDDAYLGFLDLVTSQIGTAIANARAYEEEKRRAESLAELDRAKTTFFSNVSHEFRTPLTLILGPLDDAINDTEQSRQRDRLLTLQRNALRLQKLVNTLLDFSRIEARRVQVSFQPVDLSALTRDLVSNFRSACEKADLQLVVDCVPLSEPVYVDAEMWEKIVLNLVSNAFKFTLKGRIEITLRQVDQNAELVVRDTGVGIPADQMPRLFERFHRVEGVTGRSQEGSGIGLALVRELVRLHGGEVGAESMVGKGTSFVVQVPLGTAHLQGKRIVPATTPNATALRAGHYVEEALRWLPDANPDEDESLGSMDLLEPELSSGLPFTCERPRVLLADDNADMRQYLHRILSEHYHVEAVSDGQAALDAVRRAMPDLILTDVMMPRLDGFGLLREVRADPHWASVPVILLSARAGEESRVEGMQAGADDYLVKPFSVKELLARVGSLLQIARLRRESEQAIRQSEERLRAVVETTPACIKVVAADGTLISMNSAGLKMVDADRPEDVQGGCVYGLIRAEYRDAYRQFNERVCQGQSGSIEFEIEGLRGTRRHMETHAVPLRGSDGSLRQLAITLDITERKRAEALRAGQRSVLELIARSAPLPDVLNAACRLIENQEPGLLCSILLADNDGRHTGAAFGPSLPGDFVRALQGVEIVPPHVGSCCKALDTGQEVLVTDIENDGGWSAQWRDLNLSHGLRACRSIPIPGSDGRVLASVALFRRQPGDPGPANRELLDIATHLAGVAIERRRAEDSLQETDRRKDEFLATLAHELRNPLAPLRNGLQLMKLARNDSNAVEQARAMMERQLGHMARLIDDLMDVSRISRGKVELRIERVELAKVVQQAVETSRPLVEEMGHELTLDVPPTPIFVNGDLIRLAQVFANLLNNATKYTERGGRIALRVERDKNDAVISVRDTGVGIPTHMLPRVFEMFTQVDHSLERSQGGLGIGLSLVKGLVEMHGGKVEARSNGHGTGSEFVVRLPVVLSLAGQQQGEEADPTPTAPTARRRILVVDDNRDSADSLALLLRIMGNDTQTAHDGLEALELAASFRPDVILLDIGMPNLNGHETARRIRQQPWGSNVVLVAQTGWGQEDDKRLSREAGFDLHIVKPVDPTALEELLAELQARTA